MGKIGLDFSIERYGLNVRLVNEDDAEFILSLRTDAKLSKHLHDTTNNVELQREWIRNYKIREKSGEDYYFIYTYKGKLCGVNRLYNIKEHSFTIGSWIFSPESPLGISIYADIILKELGFETFKYKFCLFEVRKGNIQVQKYHSRYNPEVIGESDLDIFYKLSKENFEENKVKYMNLIKQM